jgi:hypothetical protein
MRNCGNDCTRDGFILDQVGRKWSHRKQRERQVAFGIICNSKHVGTGALCRRLAYKHMQPKQSGGIDY